MMASTKMRVAVGQHPGNDKEYLDFALQLGCEGASFQTPDIKGEVKWDAADMYFNKIFYSSSYDMGIVHHRLTTQADGYSLIDKQHKEFIKK